MMSQLSQPSLSISARLIGRNGAVPKRLAQYGRELVNGFAARAKKETSTGAFMQRSFAAGPCASRASWGAAVVVNPRFYGGKAFLSLLARCACTLEVLMNIRHILAKVNQLHD